MINADKIQTEANQVRSDAASRYRRLDAKMRETLPEKVYADAAVQVFEMHLDSLSRSTVARTDADLLPIFARELEYVFSNVVEQPYPELRAANGELFGLNMSIPEGASSWIQYLMGQTGVAKFVAALGTDRPLASLEGARITRDLQPCSLDYGYTYHELQAAARMPGMRLESSLASAARRGHMQLFNDTLLWGAPAIGIVGFVNHPNITQSLAADNGSGSTYWVDKTPDEIIADVNALLNTQSVLTKGIYRPNRLLLPEAEMLLIATTKLGVGDGTLTILDFLKKAHPGVSFEILLELDASFSGGNLGESCAVAYVDRSDVIEGVASMLFRQFSVQQNGLRFVVPCESKLGGVKLNAPISVSRLNGIGAGS